MFSRPTDLPTAHAVMFFACCVMDRTDDALNRFKLSHSVMASIAPHLGRRVMIKLDVVFWGNAVFCCAAAGQAQAHRNSTDAEISALKQQLRLWSRSSTAGRRAYRGQHHGRSKRHAKAEPSQAFANAAA